MAASPLNQPQHSTPLHKGRGKQPKGLRGGGALGLWLMAARGRGFRAVAYGPAPLNQPQHSTPLHKGRGEQPNGLRGGGALGLWLMAARGRGFRVVAYGSEGEGL